MKITITKIAAMAGISQGFLSNIICGRNRPHYKTAKNLAAATNTEPVLWLEGSPEEIKKALSKNREAA
jgi:transcriptional regulator with XRE-family HTH domain